MNTFPKWKASKKEYGLQLTRYFQQNSKSSHREDSIQYSALAWLFHTQRWNTPNIKPVYISNRLKNRLQQTLQSTIWRICTSNWKTIWFTIAQKGAIALCTTGNVQRSYKIIIWNNWTYCLCQKKKYPLHINWQQHLRNTNT